MTADSLAVIGFIEAIVEHDHECEVCNASAKDALKEARALVERLGQAEAAMREAATLLRSMPNLLVGDSTPAEILENALASIPKEETWTCRCYDGGEDSQGIPMRVRRPASMERCADCGCARDC